MKKKSLSDKIDEIKIDFSTSRRREFENYKYRIKQRVKEAVKELKEELIPHEANIHEVIDKIFGKKLT